MDSDFRIDTGELKIDAGTGSRAHLQQYGLLIQLTRNDILFNGRDLERVDMIEIIKTRVFKTLQRLVQNLDANKISNGAIVAEDENRPGFTLPEVLCFREEHTYP